MLVLVAMAKQFALRTEYHQWMIDLAFLPALLGVARHVSAASSRRKRNGGGESADGAAAGAGCRRCHHCVCPPE
ncbi:hypothetical protein BX661DRAFT_175151 [Kickxella alabastrina]|uniref:uncharacterized protein n=1 Tax=Kickxella alabastrina TaxID=61397 RepID=UPI00221FB372|nr:uncharacterized protein BX661DRAFT_175151 [Kickxella alabastrina]KAI7834604.1 hypothetical protein BX661DRAFT_175151 [Kickxella alabastrina]